LPRIIITMPAYQAEQTLQQTVADIPEGLADQLILVDDASPDNTVMLARQLGIRVFVHRRNRGYGGNQKTCYQVALREGADIVVLLHPDYQYDPKAVPLLLGPLLAGDADMTFGSRFAGLGDPISGGMPIYRFLGNRITTTLENLMLGSRFTDMHSGMRAFTRECLLSLPFLGYSDDFVFDSQLIVDAVLGGQRVVEVPIPTRYTKESSSISVVNSLKYVSDSLLYCAQRSLKKGRKGRRSPIARRGLRRGRALPSGPLIEQRCVLCESRHQNLVYLANVMGQTPVEEFACTTPALAQHDDIMQCRRCGMVSSRSPLEPEQILDNYKRVTDDAYLAEEAGRRQLFDWILNATKNYPVSDNRLLEIGSNVGLFLDVATRRGWQARGIEPSKWAVELGRSQLDVNIRQGTVEELDEPPSSVDVIVMLDVLEHLVDPLQALRRLRPALNEQGLLVLSTVNLSGVHARLRNGNWPWFIRSHLHYFSPQTLHAMLNLAGFRMVEWSIVPRSFHLSYIAHRAGSSQGALGRVIERVSNLVDPKIPVGWLGDITFVAARTTPDA
jgi:glycosyltransferase involved in cell wall biosynthesis/2-polyprenyl-3-methyl-5-hydroxy-6-metoxy-1,4-benzoquinol methylase